MVNVGSRVTPYSLALRSSEAPEIFMAERVARRQGFGFGLLLLYTVPQTRLNDQLKSELVNNSALAYQCAVTGGLFERTPNVQVWTV